MKNRRIQTHTFRGRKHEIHTDAEGLCIRGGNHININPDMEGLKHLEVAIHEAMHACFWIKSERVINSASRDIARFVWRLGYRLR